RALPERLRWTLWAAKESAFKAARKLDPGVPFHPRSFAARLAGDDRIEVVHRAAGRFRVWVEDARDWIHTVAAPVAEAATPPKWALELVEVGSARSGGPGEGARDLARRAVAPLLSIDPAELSVVLRDRIPHLSRAGSILPVDLSLSHHGRVVACAWAGKG
ncbi:MAG TPA: hypothetical protein VLL48_03525, partial [Longimicrobiales bacterium]|nr:hypothetical protein [Longimicrobiales bacterium]